MGHFKGIRLFFLPRYLYPSPPLITVPVYIRMRITVKSCTDKRGVGKDDFALRHCGDS